MSNKVPITARIPEELLAQVEAHAQAEGKTKTDILTDALTDYLSGEGRDANELSNLQQQMYRIQELFFLQVASLEGRIAALEGRTSSPINSISSSGEDAPSKVLPSPKAPRRLLPAKHSDSSEQIV